MASHPILPKCPQPRLNMNFLDHQTRSHHTPPQYLFPFNPFSHIRSRTVATAHGHSFQHIHTYQDKHSTQDVDWQVIIAQLLRLQNAHWRFQFHENNIEDACRYVRRSDTLASGVAVERKV